MDDREWLAQQFEAHRRHLQDVAYRMLGSPHEADDAVQEAWLRLNRADAAGVENLGGWLTTVVARICLDMLRARRARREEPIELDQTLVTAAGDYADPEREALLADSVGAALMVVLDTLAPAERLAFVLHDLFGVSFEEIAPIVERSPTAARQLASRARRRLRGARPGAGVSADQARQRQVVEAFLAASRAGNFEALLAVLDPDVVFRADAEAVRAGTRVGVQPELRGAASVSTVFRGAAHSAQLALVDGAPGLVWAPSGRPRVVFRFTTAGTRVTGIEMTAGRERVERLDVQLLEAL